MLIEGWQDSPEVSETARTGRPALIRVLGELVLTLLTGALGPPMVPAPANKHLMVAGLPPLTRLHGPQRAPRLPKR